MPFMEKVTAYITRQKEGRLQLLVFEEQVQEVIGLQVPGGNVETNEPLTETVCRNWRPRSNIRHIRKPPDPAIRWFLLSCGRSDAPTPDRPATRPTGRSPAGCVPKARCFATPLAAGTSSLPRPSARCR